MRFRLSTFLLSIAVVSLAVGWIADRKLRSISEQEIVNRERIRQQIDRANRLGLEHVSKTIVSMFDETETAEIEVVRAVFSLWENETIHNRSGAIYGVLPSELKANSFLRMIECDSPDSFREYAKSRYPFMTEEKRKSYLSQSQIFFERVGPRRKHMPVEERFPQLYVEDSNEYESFESFLARALKLNKHVKEKSTQLQDE